MGRIALCALLLSSVSGCLGLGGMPSSDVVLSANAPVVDESRPAQQAGRGTQPTAQLAQSLAQTARWRRERPFDFKELERPTGGTMPSAISSAKPAETGVEMRAAAPTAAPRTAREPVRDADTDSVTAIDKLETRARTAARSICDRC